MWFGSSSLFVNQSCGAELYLVNNHLKLMKCNENRWQDDINLVASEAPDWGVVIWIVRCVWGVHPVFPVAAAYCAVSAPTGSWLWLRVQSSGSWVLLVPATLCQCQSCSQASSLSQHGESRAWLAREGGTRRTGSRGWHCWVEPSLAWGVRSPQWRVAVVRASGSERRPAERQETGHCQSVRQRARAALHTEHQSDTSRDPGPDPDLRWHRWSWWSREPGQGSHSHLASVPPWPRLQWRVWRPWPVTSPATRACIEKYVFQRILEQSESLYQAPSLSTSWSGLVETLKKERKL